MTDPLDRLDPDLALRPGVSDARAVLVLWLLRKSFFPLLWLGFSVAFLAYGTDDLETQLDSTLSDPRAMLSGILSPLGVLVAAFVVRILANWLALAAAFPLTLRTRRDHYPTSGRFMRAIRLWRDRLYQAKAYRELRWTWAVRHNASERLDPSMARLFKFLQFAIQWSGAAFLIAMFLVIVLVARGNAG